MTNSLEIQGGGGFKRTRSYKATDKKAGMTLAELASWVQACMKEDAPGTARPRVLNSWSGKVVEEITVTWGNEDEQ